jgi:membrane protein DedA with SNARE-associated domain
MEATLEFFLRHGVALVFVYVFADQIGVPLPAVPALLTVGALAGAGKMSFALTLVAGTVASLLANLIWYLVGRARGRSVLAMLCKISLSPDSCVRRTEDLFLRYGVRSLLFAKFVPGLSTVAPPLAGVVGVGLLRFALYSAVAAVLWVGTWAGVGYVAGDALQQAAAGSARFGTTLLRLLVGATIIYVTVKWVQRRRFLRRLRIARVSVDELKRQLDSGEPVFLIDLRSAVDVATDPHVIPGALRIAPEELERRHEDIARDRDVVLYCT